MATVQKGHALSLAVDAQRSRSRSPTLIQIFFWPTRTPLPHTPRVPRLHPSPSSSLLNFGRLSALALAAAALFAAGCADNPDEQVVQFDTVPSGATVKIDGTPISSRTPTSAVLGRRRETDITFEKTAFVSTDIHIRPIGGDLSPNPVHVNLRPEILPDAPGPDPQAELAKNLAIVKQYADMGRITPEDRVYIELRLQQFYNQPPAPAKP